MSFDDYQIIYYLTAEGWVSEDAECLPAERIETWEKRVYQGSGFGRESDHWRILSFDPNVSEAERDDLRKRFPFPTRPKLTEEALRKLNVS